MNSEYQTPPPPYPDPHEAQEQHTGHCESARQMLGHAFVLFLASRWGVFFLTEAYFVYICEL